MIDHNRSAAPNIANLIAKFRSLRSLKDLGYANELSRYLPMSVLVALAEGLAASVFSTLAATKIADGALGHQTRTFDHEVLKLACGARRSHKRPLDLTMSLLSAAGEPWTLYPVTALAAAKWVVEDRAEDAAILVLGLIGSAGINGVLKRVVHRPRPIWKMPLPRAGSSGSSFPSSHATMSLATYGTMAFLTTRGLKNGHESAKRNAQADQGNMNRGTAARIWSPMLLLCGLIGWSRVYQGVHNPSDVLGSWLAGGLWLFACSRANTVTPSNSQ